jgi:hypothetical protein
MGRGNKNSSTPKKGVVAPIITGEVLLWLHRWYPLIIYCCLLVFIYILQHFNYQRTQSEEIASRLELNKERSRSIIFASMRMNNSRPSYIREQVQKRGLKLIESTEPPKRLIRRVPAQPASRENSVTSPQTNMETDSGANLQPDIQVNRQHPNGNGSR